MFTSWIRKHGPLCTWSLSELSWPRFVSGVHRGCMSLMLLMLLVWFLVYTDRECMSLWC